MFVLLVGSQGYAWQMAVNELSQVLSVPFKNYRVANDGDLFDPDNVWHNTYEITAKGAVLVRPDGHVAWRSKEIVDDPIASLRCVFNKIKLSYYFHRDAAGE